jgi:NhaP-type Na+/H+ or K+/H+ antiporter
MNGTVVTVVAGLIICYALLSRGLTMLSLTAPMLSVLAGLAFFAAGQLDIQADFVHTLAEVTLVVILFHDASTVRLHQLRHDPGIALRLLVIGFPVAMVATVLLAHSLLPAVGVVGAWLIAAAITPTDAGLGAATVLNPVVPLRVRRGLNVESGLNDGLATPIVLVALSALAATEGDPVPDLLQVGVLPVLTALGCAIVLPLIVTWCMDRSRERHISGRRGRQIATLLLPGLLFGVAEILGANVFITAFVGGLTFGAASISLTEEHETAALLETAADLLGFLVWFLFGGLLLRVLEFGIRWHWVLIAVLALTVLRVIPVALSLTGSGFRWPTVLFLGWFGPRGLATIVFGLLALEELGPASPLIPDINGVLAVTVVLSVFAHGFTAGPLSRAYGHWAETTNPPVATEPAGHHPIVSRGRAGH